MTHDEATTDGDPVEWATYTCSYRHDGAEWAFDIRATSMDDARDRMLAIKNRGTVDGKVALSVGVGLNEVAWALAGFGVGLVVAVVV